VASHFGNLFCRPILFFKAGMTHRIQKAVESSGAGTWAPGIAAHFANAGLPACCSTSFPRTPLLRRPQKKSCSPGLDAAKSQARRFFTPALGFQSSTAILKDDLPRIADGRLDMKSSPENLEIKRGPRQSGSIPQPGSLSPPTPPPPRPSHCEDCRRNSQRHWAGTHFFKSARANELVESHLRPKTSPEF